MAGRARIVTSMFAAVALAAGALAADPAAGLKDGKPDLKSAGPLAFGPDGILLIGDTAGAAIFAVDTADRSAGTGGAVKVEKIDEQAAALLGTSVKEMLINDLAVNPVSGNIYLSVSRGKGPDAAPVLLKVDRAGKLSEFPLSAVKFAKAALPNPPTGKGRQDSITRIAYVDGKVYVAGLSNEEFASKLRVIPFPFADADKGTSVEIYHGAHGKFETASPIRTFAHVKLANEPTLICAYTCTPLVRVPVSSLKPGEHLKATTIAELGNRNRPLDMITYQKDGKDWILMANNSRGTMKIPLGGADKAEGITAPVKGGGKAGVGYEVIESLKGVEQLDKLDAGNAVVLIRTGSGQLNLETVPLP